jgi:F0F1-type ATP synthase assembly protein I
VSDSLGSKAPRETSNAVKGMCFGMIFGVALGIVFGAVLDNMGFMSIGIGAGMCIGMAIGAAQDRREAEDEERALAAQSGEDWGRDQ